MEKELRYAEPPQVFNLQSLSGRNKISQLDARAIVVDRSSPWGNPFIVGPDGDRDQVCAMFERYAEWRLTGQPNWLDPLQGKNLWCWCKPKRCHGDTLLRLANRPWGLT